MAIMKEEIKVYRNNLESVSVDMESAALGCHWVGKTVVRKTTCGRFAVISMKGNRLIKVFNDALHARRYNFAIHGERLGE